MEWTICEVRSQASDCSVFVPCTDTFQISHNDIGMLSMANSGKNTNGSQFFFTNAKTVWLDARHVVFGRIVDGMKVLSKIEAVGSKSGATSEKVVVADCGEIKTKKT